MSRNVPYLGCKISLISKSEIRYEGILYTIDAKDSTIALAKVRSFGTEERQSERPLAPRDEVYEYIIFRANDIKDLQVSEVDKPQQVYTAGLPNDPAIVQHSAPLPLPYSVSYSNLSGQSPYGVCGMPPFQSYPGPVTYPQFVCTHGSRSATSSQTSLRKSPTIDAGVQVSTSPIEVGKDSESISSDRASRTRDTSQTSAPQPQRRMSAPIRQPYRGRGFRRGMRSRGRGGGMASRPMEILKFDDEYDFEQANAEFIELESKLAKAKVAAVVSSDDSGNETAGTGDAEDDACAYDRQKSFFDNISCEASRVAKGIPRFDWRVERKLNVETFGVATNTGWFRRRRGRGGYRRFPSTRGAANVLKSADPPKTVTFSPDTLVALEESEKPVEEPAKKPETIPTIEIVVEKPKDSEEGETVQEQWN